MGADIHMYVEKLMPTVDGRIEWQNQEVNTPYFRNYYLFGLIAGVRGPDDPFVSPRDCPFDVSYEVAKAKEEWGWDAHSHTHYTFDELETYIQDRIRTEAASEDTGNIECIQSLRNLQDILKEMESEVGRENGEPLRLICWFDN